MIDTRAIAVEGIGYGPEAVASQGFLGTGSPVVSLTIRAAGIVSAQAIGTPEVALVTAVVTPAIFNYGKQRTKARRKKPLEITAIGIKTQETLGNPLVQINIVTAGIKSAQKIGKPRIIPGAIDIRKYQTVEYEEDEIFTFLMAA